MKRLVPPNNINQQVIKNKISFKIDEDPTLDIQHALMQVIRTSKQDTLHKQSNNMLLTPGRIILFTYENLHSTLCQSFFVFLIISTTENRKIKVDF